MGTSFQKTQLFKDISSNLRFFLTESCQQNMNAVRACEIGYCGGTFFNYTCECNKPEFKQNPINPRECIDGK